MGDCEKIERLLWDYPEGLDNTAQKEMVSLHLTMCENCRRALSTIQAVRESKEADKRRFSAMDADAFDNAVLAKIGTQSRTSWISREDRGYRFRMAVSVGVAAAIVTFMIFSIKDLEKLTVPLRTATKAPVEAERYRSPINIQLEKSIDKRSVEYAPKGDAAADAEESRRPLVLMPAPDKAQPTESTETFAETPIEDTIPPVSDETMAVISEDETQDQMAMATEFTAKEPVSSTEIGALDLAYETVSMPARAKKPQLPDDSTRKRFSILSSPVTNPSPDSVNIADVYLTDEALPEISQQARALLPEIVIDTGLLQMVKPPASVLVTVEKMPVAINVELPEYPVWARKGAISGIVWVKARVGETGDVTSAEIISSNMPGIGFEEAALEAAKKSRYAPAEANGVKIPVWIVYPVKFIFKN